MNVMMYRKCDWNTTIKLSETINNEMALTGSVASVFHSGYLVVGTIDRNVYCGTSGAYGKGFNENKDTHYKQWFYIGHRYL